MPMPPWHEAKSLVDLQGGVLAALASGRPTVIEDVSQRVREAEF